MPTDLGMSSTLNSDYMPYMKEPSLHLSDEPRIIAVSPFAETSYISTLGQQAFRSIPKMFPLTLQPDYRTLQRYKINLICQNFWRII